VHSRLKQPIERALGSSGITWITRRRLREKRLILAYHGILPDGARPAGQHALFIPQRRFAAHLDLLREISDVAALTRLDEEGDGRPRLAITIDDAYSGAVREGVEELAHRSIPATIFVAPGRLNGDSFWWDALADATGKLDDRIRNHALQSLGGYEDRVRDWALRLGMPVSEALPDHTRTATTRDLHAALQHPGLAFGSHAWSHCNLALLTAGEIFPELYRSREWLKAEFGERTIDWLAYPYGLDSAEVQRVVEALSYTTALRISGGWHTAKNASRFARPRLNIPATLSVDGLRARVLGAVGARTGRK
jgi:peptidoglycan/xylan/chitin deacetylase (PgdA/CDA1 family)